MDKYEVVVKTPDGRYSLFFGAESFAHAEEQCIDFLDQSENEEIIQIVKDYA